MKRSVILIACCLLILTACQRQQENYNAYLEYHFAEQTDEISVKAIMGTIKLLWVGDFYYKGEQQKNCDIKAHLKYRESVAAIILHANDLKPYFNDTADSFTYTLKRTTDGENYIMESVIFTVNEDGIFETEDVFSDYQPNEEDNDSGLE
ncbi:MAG: hypothetical protein J5701_03070 [Bacteroidales bacterium]|nr:hypothetical protein [Bacteroidales bacterium]